MADTPDFAKRDTSGGHFIAAEGMLVDIIDGNIEFHRDDEGNVTIIEREAGRTEIVIVPSDVWQRCWARLVSLAEFRKLDKHKGATDGVTPQPTRPADG